MSLDGKSAGPARKGGDWSMGGPASDEPPDPKRWIALTVILTAAFMDMLDVTIVNVAVPSVRTDLDAGFAAIQWITAGYQLAFALLLITGGRLGDIFGRKRVFLSGVVGFTVASLLSGVAVSPGMLVGARVLQGVFAAVMVPQVLSIIHVTFTGRERMKAFALFGAISGFAAVCGLCLGGLLVQADVLGLGWRAIFLINVPIGAAGLVVGWRMINESRNPRALRMDLVGMVLATAGLLLLLLPLTEGREEGWPVWGYVSMVLAVPVLAAFVLYERHKTSKDGSPLVALGLFRTRVFSAGLGIQLAFNIGVGVWFLSWTLYMQVGLGWTPMHAGLTALPYCVGAFSGAAASMSLVVPRIGRHVLTLGAVLIVVALAAYMWLGAHYGQDVNSWQMTGPLLVFGWGFGLIVSPIPRLVLTKVPPQDAGSASGLINTTQQLGAALGTALASVVFFGVLGHAAGTGAQAAVEGLRADLAAAQVAPARTDALIGDFRRCAADRAAQKDPAETPRPCAAGAGDPHVASAFAEAGAVATARTYTVAFRVSLWTVMGLSVVTLALGFLLPRTRKETARTPQPSPQPAPEPGV